MEIFGLGLEEITFNKLLIYFNLNKKYFGFFYLIWMNLNTQRLLNTQNFEEERQPLHTANDRCVLVDEITERFAGLFQRRWTAYMIAHPEIMILLKENNQSISSPSSRPNSTLFFPIIHRIYVYCDIFLFIDKIHFTDANPKPTNKND